MSHGYGLGNGRLGGRGGAFTPKSLPGLVAWFRADKGTTIATGVSAWADQSGTGDANKNLAQATGSKQPTLNASDAAYNNQTTLSFASASSQCLSSGTWAVADAQPNTIFVVGNDDGSATAQWFTDNQTGSVPESALFTSTSLYVAYAGSALSSGVAVSASPKVLAAIYNGGSSTVYVSAVTPKATGAAGANSQTGLTVGASSTPSGFLNGKVAEVVAYNRALTSPEISQVMHYLGARYAIAIGA